MRPPGYTRVTNVHFFAHHLEDGVFTPTEAHEKSATVLLDELWRWTEAMAPLRQPAAPAEARG